MVLREYYIGIVWFPLVFHPDSESPSWSDD